MILRELLENILIQDFLMILKDHQMSSSGGIFDKRFLLILEVLVNLHLSLISRLALI